MFLGLFFKQAHKHADHSLQDVGNKLRAKERQEIHTRNIVDLDTLFNRARVRLGFLAMGTEIERATAARNLIGYIEYAFQRMPWKKSRLLNPKLSYWELLSFLYTHKDELITKSQCKRHLREMSENTADYQLNALIGAGVLSVARNPHDRRSVVVSLSADTEAELDRFFASFNVNFEIVKGNYPPTFERTG